MNLPPIGFGTSPYRPDGSRIDVEPVVKLALEAGYRLFDLAEMYGNERAVGRALRGSDVVLIGKAWRTSYRPEQLRRACEASLRRIGIEAFDLYLLHAPGALRHVAPLDDVEDIGWDEFRRRAAVSEADDVPLAETWAAMRALVDAGLTKRIGVSNFTQQEIDSLDPRPYANEVPCSPLPSFNIPVIGYSPMKSDLSLRQLIERGIIPITFSTNPEHIRENLTAVR
jgi:diketogulonate reductase-like aldo/keto reductase